MMLFNINKGNDVYIWCMFIKLLIISSIFLAISLAGLAISILIKPSGRFPEIHVGHNKEMRKFGIKCAQKTDIGFTPTAKKHPSDTCCSENIIH